MLCDGNPDCPDSDDEMFCAGFKCIGLLRCRYDNICVHPTDICDGIIHCPMSLDDEKFCYMATCPEMCICRGSAVKCVQLGSILEIPSLVTAVALEHYHDNHGFRHLQAVLFVKIRDCKFSNDIISESTFPGLSHILSLIVTHSHIRTIAGGSFKDMTRLREIDLQHNDIHNILAYTFNGLYTLKSLNLTSYQLQFLNAFTFYGMTELQTLNLTSNSIKTIQHLTFYGLQNITFLDLRNNTMLYMETILYTIPSAQVAVYFDRDIYCCSLRGNIQCYVQDHIHVKHKCNIIPNIISYNTFNTLFSTMVILINLSIVVLRRKSKHISTSHALLCKQLVLANIVHSAYIVALSLTHTAYMHDFVYLNTRWLRGYGRYILSITVYIGFTGCIVMISLLVVDQLLAVKCMFNEFIRRANNYWQMCVLWCAIILLAVLHQTFINTNSYTCSPFIVAKHASNKQLAAIATTMVFTAVIVIIIPCMYYAIMSHVKNSNKITLNKKAAKNQKQIVYKATIATLVAISAWLSTLCTVILSYSDPERQSYPVLMFLLADHWFECVFMYYCIHKIGIIDCKSLYTMWKCKRTCSTPE